MRRKYIIYKYKRNYNSGKLIYLRNADRGYGLTTLLIEDAIKCNTRILVPSVFARKRVAHEIYRMGQMGMIDPITEEEAYNTMLINCNYTGWTPKNLDFILVDNQCTDSQVEKFLQTYPCAKIFNGFIQKLYD